MIKAIGDLLQLLEVEHEGGVSHQVLRTLDGVVLVTREHLEHHGLHEYMLDVIVGYLHLHLLLLVG